MLAHASSTPPADMKARLDKQSQPQRVGLPLDSPLSSPPSVSRVPRKSRPARRRRRVGMEDDSEEDIERDSGSASESEGGSPAESGSDSEAEEDVAVPESVTSAEHHAVAGELDAKPQPVEPLVVQPEPVIPAVHDWSEMVTNELDGADSSLPVIDFADFGLRPEGTNTPPLTTTTTPPEAVTEEAPPADAEPPNVLPSAAEGSSGAQRPSTSARQDYLNRLSNDPAFIPRVGAFWGHDDRLLDKGLRSMSPWWRDRQMAFRGRGRGMAPRGGFEGGRGGYDGGFVPGFRGRGRGRGGAAMYGGRGEAEQQAATEPPAEKRDVVASSQPAPSASQPAPSSSQPAPPVSQPATASSHPAPPASQPPPMPPVEQHWGHDGFEEMRRTDDQRQGFRGRGRGNFIPNVRGRGAMRGGFVPRGGAPPLVNGPTRPVNGPNATHGWVPRPEKPWTKEFSAHLYTEPALRPRHNQGPGIRLKLPGSPDNEAVIVRLPAAAAGGVKREGSADGIGKGKKEPIVKLPVAPRKEQKPSAKMVAPEAGDFAQTMGAPLVGTPPPVEVVADITSANTHTTVPASGPSVVLAVPHPGAPTGSSQAAAADDPLARMHLHLAQLSIERRLTEEAQAVTAEKLRQIEAEEALAKQKEAESAAASAAAASAAAALAAATTALAAATTAAVPASSALPAQGKAAPALLDPSAQPNEQAVQPGPPPQHIQMPQTQYASHYGYGMVLPPGIAMDDAGVCFEVATGRVVVLHQPTPPPMPPLYNPRPMPHLPPNAFGPPQARPVNNMSPDGFIPSPYSITPDGHRPSQPEHYQYTPVDGPPEPFFAPPRQTGPVPIRAPSNGGLPSSSISKAKGGLSMRSAINAPTFVPRGPSMVQQNVYAPRPSYYSPWEGSAPAGQPSYRPNPYDAGMQSSAQPLPDDPAIVGRDSGMPADSSQGGQYPYYAEQAYAYGQSEYAYTPYGYEAPRSDAYGQPSQAGRHAPPGMYY